MSDFTAFFSHDWANMLDRFVEPELDDIGKGWSWDRKAAYMVYQQIQHGGSIMTGKRGRKPTQNETAALLSQAMAFLNIVPDKAAMPNTVFINGPDLSVNNGLLKAGVRIGGEFPADVVAKLYASTFTGALANVGKEMMPIVFGDDIVAIGSGMFSANLENLPINPQSDRVQPDPPIAILNSEFRVALGKVMRLCSDTATETMMASIAVTGQTVMTTKRHTVMEAMHGNDMPWGQIFLPKAFAQALMKTEALKAEIINFGFSEGSFTVYFDNGGFLQTNTYKDAWSVEGQSQHFVMLKSIELVTDVPEVGMMPNIVSFEAGIRALASVTPADVHVTLGKIASVDGQAALDVKEMADEFVIAPDHYLAVSDLVISAKIVKSSTPNRLIFFGDKLRGCIIVDGSVQEQEVQAGGPATGWAQPEAAAPAIEAPATPPAGWGAPVQDATVLPPPAQGPVTFAGPVAVPLPPEPAPQPEPAAGASFPATLGETIFGVDPYY